MRAVLLGLGVDTLPDPSIDDPIAGWYIDLLARLLVMKWLNNFHKRPKDEIMGWWPLGSENSIEDVTSFGKVVMRLNSSIHKWRMKGGFGNVLGGL